VRIVTRYVILLLVPAILLALLALSAIRAGWSRALAAAVAVLLVAEELTGADAVHLDRAKQLQYLTSVPAAPPWLHQLLRARFRGHARHELG
jgi:hypothetical protein